MHPQTHLELEHKLLNQHHDHYVSFSRLLLSLSTGSFTLLAAFQDSLIDASAKTTASKLVFPLLLASILFGVLVQHRIVMNPLRHLRFADTQLKQAAEKGPEEVVILRRRPSRSERVFFWCQEATFAASFVVIAFYVFKHAAA